MSRIDNPRRNAPITIARSGSLSNTLVLHGNSFEMSAPCARAWPYSSAYQPLKVVRHGAARNDAVLITG